ncbi:MAG: hypothetical protein LBU30_00470, partial [Candidatus Methanoplasma sp.]|nr:hypothetical protein [Candidatus Methanoplasma sp.]
AVLDDPEPYSSIPRLPALISEFNKRYGAVLSKQKEGVRESIDGAISRVMEELASKPFMEGSEGRFESSFDSLYSELAGCNNMMVLMGIKSKADKLRDNLLDEMDGADPAQSPQAAAEGQSAPGPAAPKIIRIRAKDLTGGTWRLGSEGEIDKNVDQLRKKLKDKLGTDTTLRVEF